LARLATRKTDFFVPPCTTTNAPCRTLSSFVSAGGQATHDRLAGLERPCPSACTYTTRITPRATAGTRAGCAFQGERRQQVGEMAVPVALRCPERFRRGFYSNLIGCPVIPRQSNFPPSLSPHGRWRLMKEDPPKGIHPCPPFYRLFFFFFFLNFFVFCFPLPPFFSPPLSF